MHKTGRMMGVKKRVVVAGTEAGERAKVAILQKLEASDDAAMANEGQRVVPLEVEKAGIVALASGLTGREIEAQLGITREYVQYALARRFGGVEEGKRALKGLILENAIACNVHASTRITEMTGPQAVVAGAILTDKMLAIERAEVETPRTVDFAAFADLGDTLRTIGEIIAMDKSAD